MTARIIYNGKIILIVLLMQTIFTLVLAENAQEYNNKGVNYLAAGDYDNARECLENAYNLAPANKTIKKNLSTAYANIAYQYGEKDNWLSAINYGKKAYQLDNNNPRIAKNLSVSHNNYGFAQMKEGNVEEAYDNFDKSLKLDNENWSAYVNIGNLVYQQGKMEEAANYWRKALALHPDLPDIKNKVASLEKESKIGEKFNRQGYSHFEVKYDGSARQDLANKVLTILNIAYYRVGSDLNNYPAEKVTVIIYTPEQYGEVTGNPAWLPGEAEGNGIIRLTAADIEKSEKRLENVLYHEYTHILVYRKVGLKIPRWLDEGLAQYKEPDGGDKIAGTEFALLKKHLTQGTWIPLADLDKTWSNTGNEEAVGLAYAEAKSLILYLIDRYNFYQVLILLDKLKTGKDINQALKDIFYLDLPQLEQNCLAWLKGK